MPLFELMIEGYEVTHLIDAFRASASDTHMKFWTKRSDSPFEMWRLSDIIHFREVDSPDSYGEYNERYLPGVWLYGKFREELLKLVDDDDLEQAWALVKYRQIYNEQAKRDARKSEEAMAVLKTKILARPVRSVHDQEMLDAVNAGDMPRAVAAMKARDEELAAEKAQATRAVVKLDGASTEDKG